MIKTVFCGSPEFAAASLRYLTKQPINLCAVVTMPDKKTGRGQHIQYNPVKLAALEHNLLVLQPEKATDPSFLDTLRALKPDVIAVVAYGKILRPQFLSVPRYACINLHGSLLPKYRGPSPIHAALLNGDTITGLTTFVIQESVDSGPMILDTKVPIESNDTLGTLHDKLAHAGALLLAQTLLLFENGMPRITEQNHALATFTEKITPDMALIDWSQPAVTIRNKIRAFNPFPGAYTYMVINGKHKAVKLFSAQIVPAGFSPVSGSITVNENSFSIQCGTDALLITELQPEGKKRMHTDEFIRGYRLSETAILDGQK
ncbi:methionyl-tRNA formyltransferase [bacterium]|nr:methionyl-tRNA formyltransferase [bacterium]